MLDTLASINATSELSIDELCKGIIQKNRNLVLDSINKIMQEGESFVFVLRALNSFFKRLYLVKAMIEEGETLEKSLLSLKPQVHFKQKPFFTWSLNQLNIRQIESLLKAIFKAEGLCKSGVNKSELLLENFLINIALKH